MVDYKFPTKTLVVGVTDPKSSLFLKGQLHFMSEHGFKVFLLTGSSDLLDDFCKEERCSYVPIQHIKREISIFDDLRALWEIGFALRKIKPDIVNFGTPKMGLLGMIASFCLGIKLRIYTCRGFRFETEKGFLKRFLIELEKISGCCAHKILCISPSLCAKAIAENIFLKQKIFIINKGSSNGIDLDLFSDEKIKQNVRKEITLTYFLNGCFIYGFVGRICKDKGIFELYEAFSAIYEKYKFARLLLIGKLEDSLDKVFVSRLLSHEGIIYLGVIPKIELPTYYSLFDIFVLPTYREGFGNVLVEAAAMGVPIISTLVTGAQDAIENDYNGKLVPVGDVSSLAETMELMQNDFNLRKMYGFNGKKWAKNFRQTVIWNGLLDIYNM